jgi:hypothetical protein
MAADASIVARIGGDASGLVASLDKAKGAVQQFGKGVGEIAEGIGRKFEFRDIARTLSTALGLSLTSIADKVARFYVGLGKEEEAFLERMVESTGKAAEAQEEQLKRVRAAQEKYERERAENIEKQRTVYLNAIEDGKKLDAEKAAAQAKLEEDAGFAADLEWVKEQDRIAAEKKLKAQQIEELKAIEIKANEELAAIEQARIDEKFKSLAAQWKGFIVSLTRTGRSDTELSDRELERKRDTIKKDLSEIERKQRETGQYNGSSYFQNLELNSVNQELALRQKVKQYTATFGEDRAFQMLPGVTEQRFSQITGTQTQQDKTNLLLEQIKKRLEGGIPTLQVNSVVTTGS